MLCVAACRTCCGNIGIGRGDQDRAAGLKPQSQRQFGSPIRALLRCKEVVCRNHAAYERQRCSKAQGRKEDGLIDQQRRWPRCRALRGCSQRCNHHTCRPLVPTTESTGIILLSASFPPNPIPPSSPDTDPPPFSTGPYSHTVYHDGCRSPLDAFICHGFCRQTTGASVRRQLALATAPQLRRARRPHSPPSRMRPPGSRPPKR